MNTPSEQQAVQGWAQFWPYPLDAFGKLPPLEPRKLRACVPKPTPVFDASLEVPQDIIDAARNIEIWMKQHGHEKWKLMGIQSREP